MDSDAVPRGRPLRDVEEVRALQDAVEIAPTAEVGRGEFVATSPARGRDRLSELLRRRSTSPCGRTGQPGARGCIRLPVPEHRPGRRRAIDIDALDDAVRRGVEAGFADAMELIRSARRVRGAGGEPRAGSAGRAARTGSTTCGALSATSSGPAETCVPRRSSSPRTRPRGGEPLDASQTSYIVKLDPPPPVDGPLVADALPERDRPPVSERDRPICDRRDDARPPSTARTAR